MAHARLQTLPPQGRPGRKSSANTDLLYQTALEGHYRLGWVNGNHTETIARKCGQCGDSMPACGFAPAFDESGTYKVRVTAKRVLLCWNCYMAY